MENNRINLLFVVSSLCFGGAEKHLVTLLNHLDCKRFRLSLAYLKNDPAQLPQIDAKKLEGRLVSCEVSRKIDLPVMRRLARQINKEEIDIIVCVNTYPLLYSWLARMGSGRDPRVVEIFHSTEISGLNQRLQMLFYRPFFGICDTLIYVCENQRSHWRAKALRAKRDTVIHNGIDIDYFTNSYSQNEKNSLRQTYGFTEDDYVVGLCAAMRPEKAHQDLLQAIALLKNTQSRIKCLLIGDGAERFSVEEKIKEMGLIGQVRITGFMADVRPAISACDVMAMVSHSETFSIATLEAMSLGKPVIASEIGGAGEQLTDGVNGYLYRRGDIIGLADALKRLMDAAVREPMGARARASVAERFSLPVMISAYERLFSGLVRHSYPRAGAKARDAT